MLTNIPERLKSRKLFAFLFTTIIVLADYIFGLKLPSDAVYSLVAMSSTYILGQGYVDGKQQPVKELPIGDITNSFADIIQTEIAKIPYAKDFPIADLMSEFKVVLSQELGKVSAGQPLSIDDIFNGFKALLAEELKKVNVLTVVAPTIAPEPAKTIPSVVVPEVKEVAPAVNPAPEKEEREQETS